MRIVRYYEAFLALKGMYFYAYTNLWVYVLDCSYVNKIFCISAAYNYVKLFNGQGTWRELNLEM